MADQEQKQPETDPNPGVEADQGAVTETPATEGGEGVEATAADAAPADEPTPDEIIAQLQDELAGAKDAALRAQADAQNVQRRADMDVEKARKFALERFASDLLPVIDNLERALEAAGEDDAVKAFAEGVELTLKSFIDVMGKFHIQVVDPAGEPFDPNLHQAMSMVENDEVEPNTVIAVMQKGYTLNERLVRPAMVMVSKAGGDSA